MAKNPSTVWEFETNLKEDLRAKTKLDAEEILAIKKLNLIDLQACCGHARKNFSLERMIEEYITAYKKLLELK